MFTVSFILGAIPEVCRGIPCSPEWRESAVGGETELVVRWGGQTTLISTFLSYSSHQYRPGLTPLHMVPTPYSLQLDFKLTCFTTLDNGQFSSKSFSLLQIYLLISYYIFFLILEWDPSQDKLINEIPTLDHNMLTISDVIIQQWITVLRNTTTPTTCKMEGAWLIFAGDWTRRHWDDALC